MIGKNNPWNLRYNALNRWKGQTGSTRGFCDFESLEMCCRAVAYLVCRSYRSKGVLTYRDIIERYAPALENDTEHYIDYICGKLRVFSWQEPNYMYDYARLLYWIQKFENGCTLMSLEDIYRVIIINKFVL